MRTDPGCGFKGRTAGDSKSFELAGFHRLSVVGKTQRVSQTAKFLKTKKAQPWGGGPGPGIAVYEDANFRDG